MTDFICVPACSGMHYVDSLSQFALAKKRCPVAGEAFVTHGLIAPPLYLSVLTLNSAHHAHSVSLLIKHGADQLISV